MEPWCELYRESRDADLGIAPIAIKDGQIIAALQEMGYARESGNRYVRRMDDLPVRLTASPPPDTYAAIDILTPAYTSRARDNVRISEELTTTEVPGLAIALKRPGIELDVELHRLNHETLNVRVVVPDEVSAVVLKALAWRQRAAAKDAVDMWRTLEVAFAGGMRPADFDGSWAKADRVLDEAFAKPDGAAMQAIAESGSLSSSASRKRHTRIRALMNRLVEDHEGHGEHR